MMNEWRCARAAAWALGLGVLLLTGCGGGGGGGTGTTTPPPGGTGSGGQPIDAATLAGTYELRAAGDVAGAFTINKSAQVTACTVGAATSCTGQVTAGSTTQPSRFELSGGTVAQASGSIAADGAVDAQLRDAQGATQSATGSRVAATYADCAAPRTLVNGSCTAPAQGISLRPGIGWAFTVSPAGRTYTLQLCYDVTSCTAISSPIFVSNADLGEEEFPGILAYAYDVATEFKKMIDRMWTAKTYPSHATMVSVLRNAVDSAVATQTRNAVETATSGFAAAGFPAAGGGSGGVVSETPPLTPLPMGVLQPVGYVQITTPPKHKQFPKDICTSWQVIGAPVKLSTCSFEDGSYGYVTYENNAVKGTTNDLCYRVRPNNGSAPYTGCYDRMDGGGTLSQPACSPCARKNGGADVDLIRFGDNKY